MVGGRWVGGQWLVVGGSVEDLLMGRWSVVGGLSVVGRFVIHSFICSPNGFRIQQMTCICSTNDFFIQQITFRFSKKFVYSAI